MGPTSREREYFLRIVWPPCSPDTLRIVMSDGVMKADYIFFSTHVSLLTSLSHTQYRQGRSGRWREVDALKVGIDVPAQAYFAWKPVLITFSHPVAYRL